MKNIILILITLLPRLILSNDTIKVQKTITFNLEQQDIYEHVINWFELNKSTPNDITLLNIDKNNINGFGTKPYDINKESIFYYSGNKDKKIKTTNKKGFTCFNGDIDYTINIKIKNNQCFVLLCFLNLKTNNGCGFETFDNCSPTVYKDMELKCSNYSNDLFTSLEVITTKSTNKNQFIDFNASITEIKITNDSFDSVYRKVAHTWGATYYFKNGKSISELVWVNETKN